MRGIALIVLASSGRSSSHSLKALLSDNVSTRSRSFRDDGRGARDSRRQERHLPKNCPGASVAMAFEAVRRAELHGERCPERTVSRSSRPDLPCRSTTFTRSVDDHAQCGARPVDLLGVSALDTFDAREWRPARAYSLAAFAARDSLVFICVTLCSSMERDLIPRGGRVPDRAAARAVQERSRWNSSEPVSARIG